MIKIKLEIEYLYNRSLEEIDINGMREHYVSICQTAQNNDNMLYDWNLNLKIEKVEKNAETENA